MYQGIIQTDSSVLQDLKLEHLKTLSAPLDAYWEEALIGFSDHYEITIAGLRAGYYSLNSDNQLVAFYLSADHAAHGEDAFSYVISEHRVPAALAGTNDGYWFCLCLDRAISTDIHSLLFQDNKKVPQAVLAKAPYSFEPASESDFDEVFKHYVAASGSMDTDSVETGYEDIKGYVQSVMDQHLIFVLRDEGELIATSECRISKTQKPYADVGMIVAEAHRRKGVGSYILACTKEFCYEQNVSPICSCEASNIGSKKAILNAGFVSRHRVVLIEFST